MLDQSERADVVIRRTYSRPKADGSFESWEDIIQRVFNHQKYLWERAQGKKLSEEQTSELTEFIQLMREFKVSSSGRTLWMADMPIAKKREIAHFNCCFLKLETVRDFVDGFWLLLQGAGVGFKCGSGYLNGFMTNINDIEVIPGNKNKKGGTDKNTETFDPVSKVWTIQIGDSAEAWAKSVGKLLAGKYPAKKLVLDFSQVRAEGVRLKGYGWISTGYKPLAKAYQAIVKILNRKVGCLLSKIDMLDIMNHLGQTLSSRRSAQICLFDHNKPEWQDLARAKVDYYQHNPHRSSSNNTLMFWKKPPKSELKSIMDMIVRNGGCEPGIYNAEAATSRATWFTGTNPCFSGSARLLTRQFGYMTFRELAALEEHEIASIKHLSPIDHQCHPFRVKLTGRKQVNRYSLSGQTYRNLTVECTSDHRFMAENGDEIEIGQAYIDGTKILTLDRETVSVSRCDFMGEMDVYDFQTTAPLHWGVVDGLIAHNCGEVLLNDGGICNLTEINLAAFKDNMAALLRAAYLVGRANYRQTTVILKDEILQEKWHVNNEFLRLCGVGITGMCQRPDITPHDYMTLRREATYGAYSMADELGLQRPKNITVVKPSGSLSKIFGCTEGAHKPLGKYIINNIVFGKHDPLIPRLRKAGYQIKEHPYDDTAYLVAFPIKYDGVKFDNFYTNGRNIPVNLESAVEQLNRYKMLMENWCDQNCSITVSYSPEEADQIVEWLYDNWESYVGVSFMLRNDPTKRAEDLGHPYLPQEVVSREEFDFAMKGISKIDFTGTDSFDEIDMGAECSSGACPIR